MKKVHLLALIFLITSISPISHANVIFPIKQIDKKGEVSNQPLAVLQTLEQIDQEDNWDSYQEFKPNNRKYRGIYTFDSSASHTSDIIKIELLANYRGAEMSFQKWEIKLRNFQTKKWVTIANNVEAQSWKWLQISALINDNPQQFIDSNQQIQVLYQSNNDYDSSQLDYLALTISSSSTPLPPSEPPQTGTWWKPTSGLHWQFQYAGTMDYSIPVDIFNLDLFDTPAADIAALKAQGKKVVCYFSAGSIEDWRTDVNQFQDSVIGNDYEGWVGEKWLDIRNHDVLLPIMQARIELAAQKGCDAVDPDNINGYENNTGFPLSYADQIRYNKALADLAHQANLAIGLKNDLNQITDLLNYFDFAINESCYDYNECHLLSPFIAVNKPVISINYELHNNGFCTKMAELNMDGIKKNLNLDAWLQNCQ
ncbi:MAG: endo alpha-1,4 polygalactosaminidase [Methylococcales bacterium]|nr:endo alpha-1,4 polygalactosaminidase [Methylococcales bacterium]